MITIKQINEKEGKEFAKKEWLKFNKEKGYVWKDEAFYYWAYEGEVPAGYMKFKINGGVAYLDEIIIPKENRRKGIGEKLIKKFEELAKEKKCHQVYLKTSEKHTEAIQFYKKQKYKIITTLPNHTFNWTWYIFAKEVKN